MTKKEPTATLSIGKEFPLSKAKLLKPQIEVLVGGRVTIYEDEVYICEKEYDRVNDIMSDLDDHFQGSWSEGTSVKEVLHDVASMRKTILGARKLLDQAAVAVARLEDAAKRERAL